MSSATRKRYSRSRVSVTPGNWPRSEEHTSELQSRPHLVCRLLRAKKSDTAGLADQRMGGERLQLLLQVRTDLPDVSDNVALGVDLQGFEADGRRHRVSRIG